MLNIYVTYDKISEEYSQPWFAKNDNVAIRNMRIASQREALPLDDVKLFYIGTYDIEKGLIIDNTQGKLLALGQKEISLEVIKKE